ncbi:glycosyltransferase family 39 protein, partial [bacterium]|nr:glycosyltransferase family 39 protein [bacterium]
MQLEKITEFYKNHKTFFGYFALFLCVFLLYFCNLGAYELMDVDETRYVSMSKDMFLSRDFLTLYLNGEFFFEKPPLYFWLENLSFLFFGINEFSARIPSALAGILSGVGLYFATLKFTSNKKFALYSCFTLLSCAEFLILSKVAILDIFLALTVTISILCGFMTYCVQEKNKKYFWWLFYLFSALAVLAKGIPGFVLPFFAMGVIGIYSKKLKEYFRPQYFLVGILIFLLVFLPWHIIMFKMHNPLFYDEYIIKHHIMRFLGGKIIHRDQPFWYYIPVFLVGIMPFGFLFISLLVEKIKNFKYKTFDMLSEREKFTVMSAITCCSIFLFFTSSTTKLMTYIVP